MSSRRRSATPLVSAFALLGVGIVLIEVDVGPKLALAALGVAAFVAYIVIAVFWLLSPRRLSDAGPDWIPKQRACENATEGDSDTAT